MATLNLPIGRLDVTGGDDATPRAIAPVRAIRGVRAWQIVRRFDIREASNDQSDDRMSRVVKRMWIPLLILAVALVAGFTVQRVRTYFGQNPVIVTPRNFADDAKPFKPKVVTYEIIGEPGAYADINYLDLDAKPQRIDHAELPWKLTLSTTAPAASPNIVAQGNGDSITCRVTVDDELKDNRTSNGVHAQTFCLVKSA